MKSHGTEQQKEHCGQGNRTIEVLGLWQSTPLKGSQEFLNSIILGAQEFLNSIILGYYSSTASLFLLPRLFKRTWSLPTIFSLEFRLVDFTFLITFVEFPSSLAIVFSSSFTSSILCRCVYLG